MDKVFTDHFLKNIEVYMDYMVVKSDENSHHEDLLEIFEVMKNTKLGQSRKMLVWGLGRKIPWIHDHS